MSQADRDWTCRRLDVLLVDYVDGTAAASDRELVEAHCAGCPSCAESLHALREVPARLLAETEEQVAPDLWVRQRRQILAAVDEVVEARRPRGFDYRLLLPVAAAMVIGLAGVLSLLNPGEDVSGTRVARAAFEIEMSDPFVQAEVSEVVGVPLFLSEALWDEGGVFGSIDAAPSESPATGDPLDIDDLGEDDVDEVEDLLGLGWMV